MTQISQRRKPQADVYGFGILSTAAGSVPSIAWNRDT